MTADDDILHVENGNRKDLLDLEDNRLWLFLFLPIYHFPENPPRVMMASPVSFL